MLVGGGVYVCVCVCVGVCCTVVVVVVVGWVVVVVVDHHPRESNAMFCTVYEYGSLTECTVARVVVEVASR